MSIEILAEQCIGCGQCVEICPGSLIKRDDRGKAWMKYPQNCWGCASCLKECPSGAIRLYLGRDMGGLGGKLSIRRERALLHWKVEMPDGSSRTITVNSKNANQY